MADSPYETREGRELARVREHLGADLLRALTYPGGPRQLYGDVLQAEHRLDQAMERIGLAMAVLKGEADALVHIWEHRRYEADEALCDHCKDLSARMMRSARDRAIADRDRERQQHSALMATVRRALRGLVNPAEDYDSEALRRRLCQFFGLVQEGG